MNLDSLVDRFQHKDIKAYEQLYAMYADNITGVIHTIVRDEFLAQEISQDVFLKIWDKADSYNKSKGRFFTWILNIARNAAIDELRSKSFKKNKQNLYTDNFVGILNTSEEDASPPDTSMLKSLLKDLKKKCVSVIEMLYFRGYTQKEVAEELSIPLGTVKTRNRDCIGKLRENMTVLHGR
ncbi:RNA polymerase sigma factor [Muriicola soli]|uniref:Sigma-70 family RNA polymerase sigma factor n=1 Tax=Muriicola soli TaxID=2507538 RepID=A0A411E8A3_9FLAO|nr:sigma-70 family RNA polymerase sigma factor [Muriicola soli]QBA63817.1 sigma-70 family RNA polymerase sigma factor [Muriicola soli]